MSKKKKNRKKNSSGSNHNRSIKFNTGKQTAELKRSDSLPEEKKVTDGFQQKTEIKTAEKQEKAYPANKGKKGRSAPEKDRKEKKSKAALERERKEKKKKTALIIIGSVISLVLVLLAVLGLIVGSLVSSRIVEVGEKPDLSDLDSGIGAVLCTEHGDASSVDTSSPGRDNIRCSFLGFIRKDLTVIVKDTVSPELEVRNIVTTEDVAVTPEDFVSSFSDRTAVTFSFGGDFNAEDLKSGDYSLTVRACDEGGNITEKEALITVEDKRDPVFIEYGTDKDTVRKTVFGEYPGIYPDSLSAIPAACGEYKLRGVENGRYRLIEMDVRDTLSPECTVRSFDILLGDRITEDDVFEKVTDASEVTLSLEDLPDFENTGDYQFRASALDEWGNKSEYDANVYIHRLNSDITVEAGLDRSLVADAIFGEGDREGLSLPEDFSSSGKLPGEYKVELTGKYGKIPVKVTIVDTVPPVLVLRDKVVFVGQDIRPELLVASCEDGTPVTYTFDHEPRNDKPHTETVTVTATDSAGNSTGGTANIFIYEDREPPVIYGLTPIYLNVGQTANYMNGVYAVDNSDGNVDVTFDASAVNTSQAGSYLVKYTAADKAGNIANAAASVYVTAISRESVDEIASGVLSQIINNSISQRDKAYAIFNWVRNNVVYSSRTGYLIGKFNDAAYTGFKSRAGNCYVYYAVTASLLTKAGIENMEIRRNSVSNPHYWNLVKIDGSWYHLDTCPHYAQYPITSFLLTDAEMLDYSTNQAVGYYDFDTSLYPATP